VRGEGKLRIKCSASGRVIVSGWEGKLGEVIFIKERNEWPFRIKWGCHSISDIK